MEANFSIAMQETLFPIEDFTDTGIAAKVLKELTCRQCADSFRCSTLAEPGWFCEKRFSKKTMNGHLRIKLNQPACILFTHKDNAK